MFRKGFIALAIFGLSSCGVIYHSPTVNPLKDGDIKVRVQDITPESVLVANRSTYNPLTLPAIFSQTAGSGSGLRSAGPAPEPVFDPRQKPGALATRLPPAVTPGPYRIGVGDRVLLATPQAGDTVEQLAGLLAAANARQTYTVQDDSTIAIPNVGRVQIGGLTQEEAEAELFQRLVENQIDPTFSFEIAEFNSQKVSIGGAVAQPAVAPITLTPLYLDEALAQAGGITVTDQDYASVRIYRDGVLYQIPLKELYSKKGLRRIRLIDGDSVFVDTEYELDLAQAYFEQQIKLNEYRQTSRRDAMTELNAEISIRRNNLNEARENFRTRMEFGEVDQNYVYLVGEVRSQGRYALPFGNRAMLADALYNGSKGFSTTVGDVRQIYVLRGSTDPREFDAITAWRLNASNASNFLLATRFELRPNDVIFVAEQPVTRWNRTVQQLVPSISIIGQSSAIGN